MCGVFGVISKSPIHELIHYGMHCLQHRGQQAAGIFGYNPHRHQHYIKRNLGFVHEFFSVHHPELEECCWGIGHVRYVTVGKNCLEDSQPQFTMRNNRLISMAYNGNIVNYIPLKRFLHDRQIPVQTSCDVEVILHLFADSLPDRDIDFDDICSAVNEVYKHIQGAYSVISIVTGKGLIAFRDPQGIRPLIFGIHKDLQTYAFSSETEALTCYDFQDIQVIEPGEVVYINEHHQVFRRQLLQQPHFHCSFEFAYFARVTSLMEDQEVYRIRSNLGIALANNIKKAGFDADIVVPIPDTARPAAIALARVLGMHFEEGIIKKDHIGRTFIMPTQQAREKANTHKLQAVPYVFKNKNVILVDDSIVRGTVSKKAVALVRRAGANKVYFASTYPPIRHPCFYGIDFPHQEKLMASDKTLAEIAQEIDADAVIYNDIHDLKSSVGIKDLCVACLTGEYPTESHGVEELQALRHKDLAEMEEICRS